MNRSKVLMIAVTAAYALSGTTAQAGGFLGDVARSVGNAVGGNVGQAINQAANAGDQASARLQQGNIGGAIASGGQMVIGTGQIAPGMLRDGGRAIGGDVGRVVNGAASVVSINSDVMGTATIVGGNILAGQDPTQVFAVPLAAAIRQARDAHVGDSQPLPDAVREALSDYYPAAVLDRARYTQGDLQITLPTLTNAFQRNFMGNEHAVTVDDVIVFSDVPSDDPSDFHALHWWAHEIGHVAQYMYMGVDSFALEYMRNYRGIENDADNRATVAVNQFASQQ